MGDVTSNVIIVQVQLEISYIKFWTYYVSRLLVLPILICSTSFPYNLYLRNYHGYCELMGVLGSKLRFHICSELIRSRPWVMWHPMWSLFKSRLHQYTLFARNLLVRSRQSRKRRSIFDFNKTKDVNYLNIVHCAHLTLEKITRNIVKLQDSMYKLDINDKLSATMWTSYEHLPTVCTPINNQGSCILEN